MCVCTCAPTESTRITPSTFPSPRPAPPWMCDVRAQGRHPLHAQHAVAPVTLRPGGRETQRGKQAPQGACTTPHTSARGHSSQGCPVVPVAAAHWPRSVSRRRRGPGGRFRAPGLLPALCGLCFFPRNPGPSLSPVSLQMSIRATQGLGPALPLLEGAPRRGHPDVAWLPTFPTLPMWPAALTRERGGRRWRLLLLPLWFPAEL